MLACEFVVVITFFVCLATLANKLCPRCYLLLLLIFWVIVYVMLTIKLCDYYRSFTMLFICLLPNSPQQWKVATFTFSVSIHKFPILLAYTERKKLEK